MISKPTVRSYCACLLCFVCATGNSWAQTSIAPERPNTKPILRWYQAPLVPDIRLSNAVRVQDLIRAGKLYLTAQDAIALALENNIDIESARYTPLIDTSQLQRFEAGGALPGVPSSASQAGTVASGQGVAGSQAAAGVSTTGNNQGTGNAVNATISQIGPVTPSLDPVFQDTQTYSHRSSPQPNVVQSATLDLVTNTRNYTETLSQGFITGGQVRINYRDSYLSENAPTDLLNPSNGTVMQITVNHNLLQGFGATLNRRNITVAKANLKIDALDFKGEVSTVVANTLDLYYGLGADYEDVKAKQTALKVAQQFYEDSQKQVQIGTMAPLDVTTAEAQVASAQLDLVTSQSNLEEQQISLKNTISRKGIADPLLADVQIIPLDHIVVPEQDNLPPLQDLVATAKANRTDLLAQQIALSNSRISALGTENGVRPQLSVFASASSQGLTGTAHEVVVRTAAQVQASGTSPIRPGFTPCPANIAPGALCETANSYFVGGIGNALGQTFRRDFPTESANSIFSATLRNRQAQSDYAVDQLAIRQTELQDQKNVSQTEVNISNQLVGLQQARVRYQAAVRNRILEEQLLTAEQRMFAVGAATSFAVVQQQRDLSTAQSSEVAALVGYSNAKIAFQETLGTILQDNGVSVDEALSGHVSRSSTLPAVLPEQP